MFFYQVDFPSCLCEIEAVDLSLSKNDAIVDDVVDVGKFVG